MELKSEHNHSQPRCDDAEIPYAASSLWYADRLYALASQPTATHADRQNIKGLNRCVIAGPGGLQTLTVPILGSTKTMRRTPFAQLKVSEHGNWRLNHWRAIFSAYGKAPFFEHFAPLIEPLYARQWENLADLNTTIHNILIDAINLKAAIPLAEEIIATGTLSDTHLRRRIDDYRQYYQVRADKFGFIGGLSALDLLFNLGKEAIFPLLKTLIDKGDFPQKCAD